MAKSMNKAILLGNVGKDPEIRTLSNGTKIATLALATSERIKDKQGNWEDRTEWHTLVAFARLAEVIEQYVRKGSKLCIEGRIATRSWDDKQSGEKKYATEIKIDDLVLCDARGQRSEVRVQGSGIRDQGSVVGDQGRSGQPAGQLAGGRGGSVVDERDPTDDWADFR
jgi:single-strand DNA-binding protein